MKTILLATTLIAAAATAFAVNAATDTAQPASPANIVWMPVGEIVAKMEAQGYQVLEIEREDGRFYEVEMRDANGFEVEAYLDATTGEPLRQMSDMGDDDDDTVGQYGDKDDD
ncbi:MAG: PepSY domain-containing protein [Marinosulfonomonas sp.]